MIGADGAGLSITNGCANELVRSTVLAAAANGRAVEMQLGASPANLSIDSSVLSGGASGVGLFVKTGVGTLPLGGAGSANVTARHVTIAGAATGDLARFQRCDRPPLAGRQHRRHRAATRSCSAPTRPRRTPACSSCRRTRASLSLTRTDQTSAPDVLFANPGRRNYHLRADAPGDRQGPGHRERLADRRRRPAAHVGRSERPRRRRVRQLATDGEDRDQDAEPARRPADDAGRQRVERSRRRRSAARSPSTAGRSETASSQTTTTPTVEHAYGGPGAVVAELVVADGKGGVSAPASVSFPLANATPPTVLITKPKPSATIALRTKKRKRATITFSGTAKAEAGIRNVVLTIEKLGTSKQDVHLAGQEAGARSRASARGRC